MAGQALDIQVPPEDILSANDLNALRDEILEKIRNGVPWPTWNK